MNIDSINDKLIDLTLVLNNQELKSIENFYLSLDSARYLMNLNDIRREDYRYKTVYKIIFKNAITESGSKLGWKYYQVDLCRLNNIRKNYFTLQSIDASVPMLFFIEHYGKTWAVLEILDESPTK